MLLWWLFFFFKQKTAYEMRISDWSSDVCSSDLWDGWKKLTAQVGESVQLVGDDLFVTNVKRLSQGIENSIANSILVKVNQIGSLSETIDAVNMAHQIGRASCRERVCQYV